MASERNLSDLLPPSPPPRPDRREAAIDAAMRRYDGAPSQPVRSAAPLRRWRLSRGPQLGMLTAAGLVAAIGLPLWLSSERQPPGVARTPAATETPRAAVASTQTGASAELQDDAPTSRPPQIVAPIEAAPAAPPSEPQVTILAAPVVQVQPAAPPAALSAPGQSGEFAAAAAPPAPMPVQEAQDGSNAVADIVITSARTTGYAKARQRIERRVADRGDWNRCTIDDPQQDVDACAPRARAAASNPAQQAAALVADGLAAAWRDDLDGAIAAFDRAIAASPNFAAAWLNRGLAHAKAGDDARALADLDRAVRYAPSEARGWFQRSLVLRRAGKSRSANADAARAVELDPRYEDLMK